MREYINYMLGLGRKVRVTLWDGTVLYLKNGDILPESKDVAEVFVK